MYCKNCKHPVTSKDEYCPKCSELLTDFTIIHSLEIEKESIVSKDANVETPSLSMKTSRKGMRLVGIGCLCILVQIFSYLNSFNVTFSFNSASGIGYFFGRNLFVIVGIVLVIIGFGKKE